MAGTELEIGAQSRAAGLVMGAIDPINATLSDLNSAVAGAADGFRGAAASGLAEALTAWFDAAGELAPVLAEYARKLTEVDVAEAQTELTQRESYSRIATRLGGGQ